MKPSIHNPSIEVPLRSGAITVNELSWPDAMHLYGKLVTQTRAFLDENGNVVFDANKLIGAIQENIELGEWLILKSTGKDAAWLAERTVGEVLDVVAEAAVLNVGIIVSRIKNARSRLREIVAGQSPTPNTKSGSEIAASATSPSS